ncbi:MAG: efflux RND transporter periplasmic adaptor subunit [Pseudomonadota bacterium]
MRMRAITAVMMALVAGIASATAQPRAAPSVIVNTVTEHPFSQRIEALGTLLPKEMAELTLNAADRVTAVYFEDGERVEEGKTLLTLVQREQLAQIEAAEARLREASARHERFAGLVEYDAGSLMDADEARRDMETSRAELRQVQSLLRDRVLVAPFAGLLGFREVSVGSYVQPGDVITTLIDDSAMRLDFSVPATRLTSVGSGTRIVAETDSLPGETFRGEITTLNNTIDPTTRSVRVRAILPNDDRLLKVGMFMRVVVEADARLALAIPEEAIQPVGPRTYVFVVDADDLAHRREIAIGARYKGLVEVLSGLSEGDRVISEGLIRARDGQMVKIIESIERTPPRQGVSSRSTVSAPTTGGL